jgi:protein kinase A/protein kinase X
LILIPRDLKPENLIIDRFGNVKLTDFGFAKIVREDRTYTLCGTPEYLAPEIIKGQKRGYCKAVDWWAIGILIYEMLVGFPPFYDRQPIGIYKKVLKGHLELPSFLTREAKDIIRKLLNPNIKTRIGVTDNGQSIIKHAFFEGVDLEEILMGRISPPWVPPLKNYQDTTFFQKQDDSQSESDFYDSFMDSRRESFYKNHSNVDSQQIEFQNLFKDF